MKPIKTRRKINCYNPQCDWDMLSKAYKISKEAHKGQKESPGAFYIPSFRVSTVLANLELDCETIVAGLLHDVLEDTSYGYKDIKEMFETSCIVG